MTIKQAHLPVIHIVKQHIEFVSSGKSWRLRYELMIRIVEFVSESTKHPSNGQVELMVTVVRSWIKDNWKERKFHSAIDVDHLQVKVIAED